MNIIDIDPDSLLNIFQKSDYYDGISLARTCHKLYIIFKENENRLIYNHMMVQYNIDLKYKSNINYAHLQTWMNIASII